MLSPICFAAFRLINNSHFFDCSAAEFSDFLLGGLATKKPLPDPCGKWIDETRSAD
jgi:hypothetical protein